MDYWEFEADLATYKRVKGKLFQRLGSPILLSYGVQGKQELMITEREEEAKIVSEITHQPMVKKEYEEVDNRLNNKKAFTWGT